jgi:hypothetical protein
MPKSTMLPSDLIYCLIPEAEKDICSFLLDKFLVSFNIYEGPENLIENNNYTASV